MLKILRADPSSAFAAALEGWEHPISREALVLMDLFDLEHAVNSKTRPKPHGMRPMKAKATGERIGNNGGRSRAEVVAILNKLGHHLPV